jgi:hypothetical protein
VCSCSPMAGNAADMSDDSLSSDSDDDSGLSDAELGSYGGKRPAVGGKRPAMGGKRPAMGGKRPAMGGKRPAMGGKRPAMGGKRPAMGGKRPAMGGKRPAMGGKRPAGKRPAMGGKRPLVGGKRPPGAGLDSDDSDDDELSSDEDEDEDEEASRLPPNKRAAVEETGAVAVAAEEEEPEEEDIDLDDDDDDNAHVDESAEAGDAGSARAAAEGEGDEEAEEQDLELDDDSDEADAEEAQPQRRPKKKARERNRFIDDVADTADGHDSEEEEEEGDHELLDDDQSPTARATHAELRQAEREIKTKRAKGKSGVNRYSDKIRQIEEQYKDQELNDPDNDSEEERMFEPTEAQENDISRLALVPTVSDPKLWMVKCKLGEEKVLAASLLQKYFNMAKKGSPINIKSVYTHEGLRGLVYVEAYKIDDVKSACKGMRDLMWYKPTMVPIKEMVEVRLRDLRVFRRSWFPALPASCGEPGADRQAQRGAGRRVDLTGVALPPASRCCRSAPQRTMW